MSKQYDFAVVGAGFFGARLALLLDSLGLAVVLIERSPEICSRASYVNQARVHNGYHYPRSYSTALGSHKHYDRFCGEMSDCIDDSFDHVYAIAHNSYVSAYQFQQFCNTLQVPARPLPKKYATLFDSNRVEAAFVVREAAFNAERIRAKLQALLASARSLSLMTETTVGRIDLSGNRAELATTAGTVSARGVFIVAYAGTNALLHSSGIPVLDLKAEITEVCIVDVPEHLRGFGVTVMDGPFFSCMPMPAEGRHSLTHVRYTPHVSWSSKERPANSYDVLEAARSKSRFVFMQHDAQTYLPEMARIRYCKSLYEVKIVPNRHEIDDGRPILMRVHNNSPLCISVVGSKFDSVFELEDAIPTTLERLFV